MPAPTTAAISRTAVVKLHSSVAKNALIGRLSAARSARVVGVREDQRGVGAAETERVRQCIGDLALARHLGDEVDVAGRGRVFQIEGRRHDAVAQGENREDRLDAAGGSEQVADRRFGRRHRQAIGVVAEQPLDRAQLDLVAERGRGAVRVDVVDLVGRQPGAAQRVAHRAIGAVAVLRGRGQVIGVAGHAVTDDLGIDFGAARLGVLQLFEHEHAGAFAHDKAVAALVPRPRGGGRVVVVAGRQRPRRGKPGQPQPADRRLGAAAHHDVGIVEGDQPRRVADRVRAGRARRHHRMVRPLEAVADRDVAGGEVDQAGRDEERRDPARPALGQGQRALGDAGQPADAGADHDAGAFLRLLGVGDPARILDRLGRRGQRKMDTFIVFAMAAAAQAVEDSGWVADTEEAQERTGVMIGSGIGGLPGITEGALTLAERGPRRISPFFIPASLINLASGNVSIRYGFKGPNHAVVTACSTGAHAIGDAARLIALDDADVMVCGGTEAAICRLGLAGFAAARALSTGYNDDPPAASRPWDQGRDGFVMGEGAGVLVLEELEHAKTRGAKIYAEVVGYGMSGDAYHLTAPSEDGNGAYRSMRNALRSARLAPDKIDYINAHGTSTPLGDEIELGAVKRLFGDHAYRLSMSSTKSAIGHLLGAAGSVEAIFSILAQRDGIVPPTLNLENPSPSCDIDLVPKVARERKVAYALSNSFGFGGTNASLIFAHPDHAG